MNPTIYPRELRARWYLAVDQRGMLVKDTAALFGISRETYYKWYARDHGQKSPKHTAQKRQPNTKLTPEVLALIEREKRLTNYGPLKMKLLVKRRLGLTVSTTIIYRFYQRKGLVRRPQKRLPWYQPLKDPVIPEKPGAVVQIDTKYVWQGRKRKFQRTFVDIYTGFHHAVIVLSLEAQATVTAFQEAQGIFPCPIQGV